MTQEKALAWLPALRDEDKIAGAVAEILDAVKKKEVALAGYPTVWARDGQKTTSETIDEKIYPTQFAPPDEPQTVGVATKPTLETAFPTAFEKRNVGVTLELEPVVLDGGKLIDLTCQMQHVYLRDWDAYEATRSRTGVVVTVKQPLFFTVKDSFSFALGNGCFALVGVHKVLVPENSIELFILHVTAVPPTH